MITVISSNDVNHIVVMGVSGSGKTTVAAQLAKYLDWPYAEADDFHPQSNIDKMASGIPLNDDDRWPWLESLRDWMTAQARENKSTIVTCSALKRVYRDILRSADGCVHFVELDADEETLVERMSEREHFMPVSLLRSQEETLEPLEGDEEGFRIVNNAPVDALVEAILSRLKLSKNNEVNMANQANIGVVGLAAMGSNLARNLAHHGNTVALLNRSEWRTDELIEKHGGEGQFIPAYSYEEFARSLSRPRTAIIMVKAGAATDATIKALEEVFEPGDIIVDGGNSFFKDTIEREKAVRATGIHFVGCGISGGEEGALNGPSMMPGGTDESWETLGPILKSIAADVNGEPCVTHIGTDGAGHYVKMVHNGIEYADMQVIGEAYDIMRRGLGMSTDEIADTFTDWNKGDLDSYLIEITADTLRHKDAITGQPLVDVIVDRAGMKGTGTWTVQSALEQGSTVSAIAESVFARALSSHTELRDAAQREELVGPDGHIECSDREEFVEALRQALFDAKVVSYAQGLNEIQEGAQQYGWNINLSEVARIWRGGCIIRAQKLLDRITQAFSNGSTIESLLFDPYFKDILVSSQNAWRKVVGAATQTGIPTPVLSSCLAYYDGLRSRRLPTALTQMQRDYFGAHTYRRVDKPGVFHTLWAEEGRPEEQQDSASGQRVA